MRIGIDFGTTHTGAAYFDGQEVRYFPLDPANRDPQLLRSMLYITRDHEVQVGLAAVQTYLQHDTGRFVRYEDKVVGTIENIVSQIRGPLEPDGPIHLIYDVIVSEDVGAAGRLIQSIKTGLRDPSYTGTKIFDRFYTIEELIALLLSHVREQVSRQTQQTVTGVVLGRPVRFAEEPEADALAQSRLQSAAQQAGFTNVTFEMEPIAAARFYTHDLQEAQTVLVFDFGGGTLDLTVLRTEPGRAPAVLATHGVLVGGDDIDSALMRGKVAPLFGTQATINGEQAPFPYELAKLLERWQTIPQLSRPQNLSVIYGAKFNGSDRPAFAALEALVLKNYGFALFENVEQAKRTLSATDSTTLDMQIDDISLNLTLYRGDIPPLITREIALVQRGLNHVLADAGLSTDEIEVVVTTGGSSLIPIFQTLLARKFSNARLVRSDTFGSVTAGLAMI